MDYPNFATQENGLTSTPPSALQALILDDDAVDRQRVRRLCRQADMQIEFTEAGSIAEFARKIDAASYDVFFIDFRLVQGDGLIALEMLKRHPKQEVSASIMVAGEGQIQVAIDAMKCGCTDFLLKDMLGPDVLSRAIANAVETARNAVPNTEDSEVEMALARFARRGSAEMRTLLSAIMRRARTFRDAAANGLPVSMEDVTHIDENCARLWEFLEEYQVFTSQLVKHRQKKLH